MRMLAMNGSGMMSEVYEKYVPEFSFRRETNLQTKD
jgi:hypothetical protein